MRSQIILLAEILIITLLAACGSKDYSRANVQYQISAEYAQVGEVATRKIESVTNDPFLHADNSDMNIIVVMGDLPQSTLGETSCPFDNNNTKNCTITMSSYWFNHIQFISTEFRYEYFRIVLTHELGHAFGLEHVSDPNQIMYYAPVIRQVDTDWAYKVYASDIEHRKN